MSEKPTENINSKVRDRKEPVVIVFDVGTQSARTMIVDRAGNVLAIDKKKYDKPYFSENLDWAEQDADFYYDCICETCRNVKKSNPEIFARIEGVSITTIRDTTICVDKDGKPLRRAVLWLDKRRAEGKPDFPTASRLALKAVGMEETCNLQFSKSVCNWIRQNQPEIWGKTYKFLLLSGYLVFKMTGNMVDSRPDIIAHLPFDNKTRDWMRDNAFIRPIFPVEREKLCDLVESGEVMGQITKQMSDDSGLPEGLPVIAAATDKACEILGLGCTDESTAAIGLGTTATISYISDKYVEIEKYIPAYAALVPGKWNPEYEIYRGYWLISWFKKEFATKEVARAEELGISPEELLNHTLAGIPAGCEGLLFQPYFTPNVTMPSARGAMIGFSDVHTRHHIYRAIVEGINYALIDGLKMMEQRAGVHFSRIAVGGGGSQSDEICQITADMFGLPVVRPESFEATGMGCAIAAFVGLGYFKNYEEGVKTMIKIHARFEPTEEEHQKYQELYESVYKNIYGDLKPLYQKLHDIYHRK